MRLPLRLRLRLRRLLLNAGGHGSEGEFYWLQLKQPDGFFRILVTAWSCFIRPKILELQMRIFTRIVFCDAKSSSFFPFRLMLFRSFQISPLLVSSEHVSWHFHCFVNETRTRLCNATATFDGTRHLIFMAHKLLGNYKRFATCRRCVLEVP